MSALPSPGIYIFIIVYLSKYFDFINEYVEVLVGVEAGMGLLLTGYAAFATRQTIVGDLTASSLSKTEDSAKKKTSLQSNKKY
jgi:hypothetical protein